MEIIHDDEGKRFFSFVDNKEYNLEYNEINENLWQFNCSFISNIITNIKEINIRESLIEYAINFMKERNISLFESGSCYHVSDFLDKRNDLGYLLKYVLK